MKTEIEKCFDGELFDTSNPVSQKLISEARRLTAMYNTTDSDDKVKREEICSQLFAKSGSNVNIDKPFYCDYGKHITLGDNIIIGISCTFVDCNRITIGSNVLIASNVQICTATHPVAMKERLVENWTPDSGQPYFRTYAEAITIEDNVWIGGGAIILPGVTIGKNSVIGAGSVVTKSIPADSLAVGNPCKVIRNINQENT